jgi:hypothetical protein
MWLIVGGGVFGFFLSKKDEGNSYIIMTRTISSIIRKYQHLIIMFAAILIIFEPLITSSYIDYWDMSTIPQFINPIKYISYILMSTSLSYNGFVANINPGLSLLFALYYLMFGSYALNLLYLTYLIIFTFGTYYLLFQFSSSRYWAALGAMFALTYLGTIAVLRDGVLTLHGLAFLPAMLGFYWRYRSVGSLKYLLISGAIAMFTDIYGPLLPAMASGLVAMEIALLLKRRTFRDVLCGLSAASFVLIIFVASHLPSLAQREEALSSLRVLQGGLNNVAFNLLQILTAGLGYPWELPDVFLPKLIVSIYMDALLILVAVILLVLAFKSKEDAFPLLWLLLIVAITGYSSNYLFYYNFLNFFHAAFLSKIDPYEFNPLVGVWYGLAIAVVGSYLRRNGVKLILVALVLGLVISSSVASAQGFETAWANTSVPEPLKAAYSYLEAHDQTFITVPSTYAIVYTFNHQWYALGKWGNATPLTFFWDLPPSFVVPGWEVQSLYSNITLFRELVQLLGIRYIVYFTPEVITGWWGSGYYTNLSKLMNASGFVIDKNFSDMAIILENPSPANYTMNVVPGYFIFTFNNTIARFYSPLIYSNAYETSPRSTISNSELGGIHYAVFTFNAPTKVLKVKYKYMIYDILSYIFIIIYLIVITIILVYRKSKII